MKKFFDILKRFLWLILTTPAIKVVIFLYYF